MDNWTMDIDPYPISALQDRYGLSSRQAVYDRINALGIKPVARGKISSDQLDKLDKLDKHIKAGGAIADFINFDSLSASPVDKSNSPVDKLEPSPRTFSPRMTGHRGNLDATSSPTPADKSESAPNTASFIQLVREIADAVRPQAEPLQHLVWLERAAASGWLLSSSEVRSLLGVSPRTNSRDRTFTRGCFTFVKSGKIGNQTAWRVLKTTSGKSSQDPYK